MQINPKKEPSLVTSLFLGQAVLRKTITLINSNNGLQVPEPKAGRALWEYLGFSSVYFNKSYDM